MEVNLINLSLKHLVYLDEDKNYMSGLIGFYADNFVSNLNKNIENVFRFSTGKGGYTFPIFTINIQFKIFKRDLKHLNVCLDHMTEEQK